MVKYLEDALPYRYEYCFLCTKALRSAADTLSPLIIKYSHPQPTYVLAQNGLGIEKGLYASLKAHNKPSVIISCAVYVMANILKNGSVLHVNTASHYLALVDRSSLLLGQSRTRGLQTDAKLID